MPNIKRKDHKVRRWMLRYNLVNRHLAEWGGVGESAVDNWFRDGFPARMVPVLIEKSKGELTAHDIAPHLFAKGQEYRPPG